MYEALGNMGLSKGNVLEPSCGVGNFMGLVPDSMEKIRMYGVELDSISGRIAQQLYQKNKIAVQGFETMQFPDSFFDCVVGNVPFGNYKVPDKRYDRHNFLIHDYFIAKSLDLVRPGGVVAVVTSSGTMDKKDSSVREYGGFVGMYELVVNDKVQRENINSINYFRDDKLVQQAISDMEKLMSARQQNKEQERSSTKKSVLDTLRSLKAKKREQPAQEQDKPKKAKKKGMEL